MDLPRQTEDIAAWLGGEPPDRIQALRAWHGDAAVVYAMEQVAELPVAERARAFHRILQVIKRRRRDLANWPRMTHAEWVGEHAEEDGGGEE